MRIGCDLHARQQTLAMLDTATGEVVSMTLKHEGNNVREFYSSLPRPVRVGIEATGSMQWFVNLMGELGIECLVGPIAQANGLRRGPSLWTKQANTRLRRCRWAPHTAYRRSELIRVLILFHQLQIGEPLSAFERFASRETLSLRIRLAPRPLHTCRLRRDDRLL